MPGHCPTSRDPAEKGSLPAAALAGRVAMAPGLPAKPRYFFGGYGNICIRAGFSSPLV